MPWYMYMLMRDAEGKKKLKKQARSNKQQSKETQHTQGSHFSKEKLASSGGMRTHDTPHSRHALRAELPRQLSEQIGFAGAKPQVTTVIRTL